MPSALQIHPRDNVATLVDAAAAGDNVAVWGGAGICCTAPSIAAGHKIALAFIDAGNAVTKFGVRIGHATCVIEAGEWVHLHNLASDHDERSNALDPETGAPADTPYE